MLRKGGNAIDAAITATAVMCVVEPAMTGIGGDCFAIIAKPGQKPIAFNASGKAPKAATPEWYAKAGIKQIETHTPHAVTVPGAIDGWATLLKDHGTQDVRRRAGAGHRVRRERLGRAAARRLRLGDRSRPRSAATTAPCCTS